MKRLKQQALVFDWFGEPMTGIPIITLMDPIKEINGTCYTFPQTMIDSESVGDELAKIEVFSEQFDAAEILVDVNVVTRYDRKRRVHNILECEFESVTFIK
jgi:hypothetical protein